MTHSIIRNVKWASVVAVAISMMAANFFSVGQEVKEMKAKGKVPAYYADVVTETQRQQIYAIQDKYAKQIAHFQAQLEAVTAQRDMEIENLLSPEQRQKINKAREDAAAKKKKTAEAKKAAVKKK